MTAYTDATRADAYIMLLQRHELSLDEIVREAVSAIVENNILELSFSDGSEIRLPWIEAA